MKDTWSAQGKRVILLARKVIDTSNVVPDPTSAEFEAQIMSEARSGLTLVGLVSLIDPPRAEIPEVMATLRGAQIRIAMVRISMHIQIQLLRS